MDDLHSLRIFGVERCHLMRERMHPFACCIDFGDAAGKEIAAKHESRVNDQSEWRFPGLTISSAKEFRFQVRRYRWVEFRGISLTPAR